jgi:hypothetical protein
MKQSHARLVVFLVHYWCLITYPLQAISFRRKIGFWPRPAYPRQRNEKYAWRKAFDCNPLFTEVSDKLKAKQYALARCPGIKVARTLWVGTRAQDIPEEVLAGNVVVKANHGSGWNMFIRDGRHDRDELDLTANGWMSRRYGRRNAEWGYYGVTAELFVEEMLFEQGRPLANEYKFYAGGGKMAFAFVRQMAADGSRLEGVLDDAGVAVGGSFDDGDLSVNIVRPPQWQQLREAALKLSEEFDFVRCDLYLVDGEVYFSELTLYTLGGFAWIEDDTLNRKYFQTWDLRCSWFMTTPQTGWRGIYARALRILLDAEEAGE